MKLLPFFFAIVTQTAGPMARAQVPAALPANAPLRIELRDQHDAPQRLVFPSTNVVVLAIADRKGSEQIDGWVRALKAQFAGRIDIRGVADLSSVPGLWRAKVRKKFQETRAYPVMMDWSGAVCSSLAPQKDVANVLALARDGTVLGRSAGPATPAAVAELSAILNAALPACGR